MTRETWTDERLADLEDGMHREFGQLRTEMNHEFAQVRTEIRELCDATNARFDKVDARFDALESRFAALNRILIGGAISLCGAILASGHL
jgi:hypothetical protein